MRESVPVPPDSPVADAVLALKHAVVHTPRSGGGSNWMSPGSIAAAQLPYTGGHCQSPTPTTAYQSPDFSASPIYDRISPIQTPFQFSSSHHHHHHHQQPQQQQQHRYHGVDSRDSSSPVSALTGSTSLYNAGAVQRPVYRRDIRDFSFGSAFSNDAQGALNVLSVYLLLDEFIVK